MLIHYFYVPHVNSILFSNYVHTRNDKIIKLLKDINCYLVFKFQTMQNSFPVPTSQHVPEVHLDRYTRDYLQILVDHKIVVSSSFLFINIATRKRPN